MKLATSGRRALAVLTAAALMSVGGVTSGALVGVANAATVNPNSVSPSSANNTAPQPKTFTITGTGFGSPSETDVAIVPRFSATRSPAANYRVETVEATGERCTTPPSLPDPLAGCGTSLTFDLNTDLVAPGAYDVRVTTTPTVTMVEEVDTCSNCLTITSPGNPSATSTTPTSPTFGQLQVNGSGFARGAVVDFLLPDDGNPATARVADPGLSFTPLAGGSNGYVASTTLRGTYTYTAGSFTPGAHDVRVTNTDGSSGSAAPFNQPKTDSVAPASIGQGAANAVLTLTGTAYDPASSVVISGTGVTTSGPVTVNAGRTVLTVPVTVAQDAAPGARNVTVTGPDGSYFTSTNALTINAGPKVTSVSPPARGQGFQGSVTVTGTGFTTGTTFTFGQGVAVTDKTSVSATSYSVVIDVADDAALGGRTVTATNPDQGTGSLANGFTVQAKPVITSITPASGSRGEVRDVTVSGTGLAGLNDLQFAPGGVTAVETTGSDTSFNATITIAPDAPFGPRNVTIVGANGGRSTCTGCFGVNSLTVMPTTAENSSANAAKQLTFTGPAIDSAATVKLVRTGFPSIVIPGTSLDGTAQNTLKASFNLAEAAPGNYDVQTTSPELSCTGCFRITAQAPPVVTTVSPATGGQGAQDRPVTITGDNLYGGSTVSFGEGITVDSVTRISKTRLDVVIDIAPTATVGPRTVTVTNGDGTSGSKASGFAVTAGPTVTSTNPSSRGQNFSGSVVVTGTGFVTGATASFGPGITVVSTAVTNATTATVAITVADNAEIGTRMVSITNPDGGTGSCGACFSVTAAPRITSITPDAQAPGTTRTVTVSGSNFTGTPTLTFSGTGVTATVSNVTPTSFKASVTVASGAALGARTARVTNADGGTSTLANGYRVANVPGTPTSVTATAGNRTATVTFKAPTSDGGSPITNYKVQAGTGGGETKDVAPNSADGQGVYSVSFVVPNGSPITFTVRAFNAAGRSEAGSATATPGIAGQRFSPITPTRVLDSRDGTGTSRGLKKGAFTVSLAGSGKLPPGATAAVLNLTTPLPASNGFLKAYAASGPVAPTSAVNFTKGLTQANTVTVKVSPQGVITLDYAAQPGHVVADLLGYYTPSQAAPSGRVTTLTTPVRAFNQTGVNNRPAIDLRGSIPAGATTALLNVTVAGPSGGGFATVYEAGKSKPGTSNINFAKGQTVANEVFAQLGTSGVNDRRVAISLSGTTTARVIVDVVGYVRPEAAEAGQFFTALTTPVRALRTDGPGGGGTFTGTRFVRLPASVPMTADSVIVSITSLNPTSGGYLTAYPSARPDFTVGSPATYSTVNFTNGQEQTNEVYVSIDSNRQIKLFSPISTGAIVDVVGYLTTPAG